MNNPGMKFQSKSAPEGVLPWVVLLYAAMLLPSAALSQPQYALE